MRNLMLSKKAIKLQVNLREKVWSCEIIQDSARSNTYGVSDQEIEKSDRLILVTGPRK